MVDSMTEEQFKERIREYFTKCPVFPGENVLVMSDGAEGAGFQALPPVKGRVLAVQQQKDDSFVAAVKLQDSGDVVTVDMADLRYIKQ
jgi:hypothetical protein